LLVILPWLMERREATLAEMAERFQLSEQELIRDLEQAAMCGLPPFLDEVIDLYVDDGRVVVGVPRFFTRPLQLTAPEGFALLAAGEVAMTLPGADPEGPLGRALAKLEALLGAAPVVVELDQPPGTADLAAAAEHGERIRISYRSASSDELTERTVTPRAVFTDRGEWYVLADDDRSGEERTFRIDRVEAWTPTGERVEPRAVEVPSGDSWFDERAEDLPRVTLRLRPGGRWVLGRFPTASLTADGDDLLVELVVASERWLEQLLLRLGPHAEVVEPSAWGDLAARAARRLLAGRYATS